jgi:predicted amidohydrolase
MDCRVFLAQVEPTLGNLSANLEMHLGEIEAAIERKADMVLFPELSLTGYFLRDQTAETALALDDPALVRIADRSRHISIGLGFVELGRDGRAFNSWAYFEDGELLHVHRKVHLVTYWHVRRRARLRGRRALPVLRDAPRPLRRADLRGHVARRLELGALPGRRRRAARAELGPPDAA